ncbi:hypothetical protein [Ferrovibrio terrae]|uniref:hypothetical protein n=1 Tax=Ferrovibrio terrae TaxID=2594003 RepID=UPI0031378C7F
MHQTTKLVAAWMIVVILGVLGTSEEAAGASRSSRPVEICLKDTKSGALSVGIPKEYLVFPRQMSGGMIEEAVVAVFLPSSAAWQDVAERPELWPPHLDRRKTLEAQWPEAKSIAFLTFAPAEGRPEDAWRRFATAEKLVPTGRTIGSFDEFARAVPATRDGAQNSDARGDRYYIGQTANMMITCRFPTVYCTARSYIDRIGFRFLIHKSLLNEADKAMAQLATLFSSFIENGAPAANCAEKN